MSWKRDLATCPTKDPHEVWLKQPLRVVAFKEIKADIMYRSLEPVTLRTWCLELNIYDSNITTQLLIFTWANLKCQISSLNFKAWLGQQGCADIMKRCWNHSGLILMGPWLMVYWWVEWSVTPCQLSAWKRVAGIQLEKKNTSSLKSKVLHHTYFCLFVIQWWII